MANLVRRNNEKSGTPSTTWDPFDMMRQMIEWDPFREMVPRLGGRDFTFAPQFDVKETKDGYIFKADLPGIDEKELDISLTGNRLTVSGKREVEEKREDETYYAFERSYGSFSRTFTLPEGVDSEHIDADLKNGVLTLHLPKTPEVKPKKISIKGVADKVRGALESKGAKA